MSEGHPYKTRGSEDVPLAVLSETEALKVCYTTSILQTR